jgi:hypothetical protein
MLGAFVESRAILLGVSIGFLILQDMIGARIGRFYPAFKEMLPSILQRSVVNVASGETLVSYIPMTATMTWTLVLVGLAVWRFKKKEF